MEPIEPMRDEISVGFTDITFETEPSSTQTESEPGTSTDKLKEPVLITQMNLNQIVAELWLDKTKSEKLASWLKKHNLLAPGTRVTAFRNRQAELQECFAVSKENTFAYCINTELLMNKMDINYIANDWRLFIDSSKDSLKAVLLHKDNKLPTIPLAYSTDTKETYQKMEEILQLVDYQTHQWRICCDLKVVAMLCGMQGGYTKYMCFMCQWDSRFNKKEQYGKHDWAPRTTEKIGQQNVIAKELVPKDKILLPPLHIKLGVFKSFIKNIAEREEVFLALRRLFPKEVMSTNKLQQGITFFIIYFKTEN